MRSGIHLYRPPSNSLSSTIEPHLIIHSVLLGSVTTTSPLSKRLPSPTVELPTLNISYGYWPTSRTQKGSIGARQPQTGSIGAYIKSFGSIGARAIGPTSDISFLSNDSTLAFAPVFLFIFLRVDHSSAELFDDALEQDRCFTGGRDSMLHHLKDGTVMNYSHFWSHGTHIKGAK
jgi:hypothetical protein